MLSASLNKTFPSFLHYICFVFLTGVGRPDPVEPDHPGWLASAGQHHQRPDDFRRPGCVHGARQQRHPDAAGGAAAAGRVGDVGRQHGWHSADVVSQPGDDQRPDVVRAGRRQQQAGAVATRCVTTWSTLLIQSGARCSSVVRAFAHGAMGRRIDPSWGGPIELFLAQRLV